MSSSSSSSAKPESQNGVTVAAEESQENNNMKQGSPQEAVSEKRAETTPSLGSAGPVQRGRDMMKLYPARSDKIYTCEFCDKGFSNRQALGGHQNGHKQEREWDKKRKEMEADYPGLTFLNPYLDKPHLLLGGYSQNALSHENHLGINLDPFKRSLYPHFGMTVLPRMTPTRFFTGNTIGSSSRSLEPVPSFPLVPTPPPPPPPRTTNLSTAFFSQNNVLNVENLISKVGKEDEIMEIDDDDDDQPDEEKFKTWGLDLSL